MVLYQRSVYFKLFLLRATFFLLSVLSFVLFFTSYSDYSILSLLGLVVVSCFSITNIKFFEDHFEIHKYYISGLIPVKWEYTLKGEVDIGSVTLEADLSINKNFVEFDGGVFPGKRYYKRSVIKISENGKIEKFTEKLTDKEYEYFFAFYLKQLKKRQSAKV
jgi:hypothetical protein